jgi:uncharacterized protein (TIGR02118 family)
VAIRAEPIEGERPMSTSTDTENPAAPARLLVLWEQPSEPEEFERHYREVHFPIARKLPGLRSYTVSREISPVRGTAYYLVAALTWDSLEELRTAFASPEGRATAADVESLQRYAAVRSMIVAGGEDVA